MNKIISNYVQNDIVYYLVGLELYKRIRKHNYTKKISNYINIRTHDITQYIRNIIK